MKKNAIKLTIKLKITLWFTIFMILLSVAIFAFIALVSSATTSHQIKGELTGLVERNMSEIEYDDWELDIDDDFVFFRNGIYCLVYDAAGAKLSGNAPFAGSESQPLEDGHIRSVSVGTETYFIYDRLVSHKKSPALWVRGIVLDSESTIPSSAVYRAALIALPLLILLAAVGGYLLAGRSLRPIQNISRTAETIGKSGDLSKRIEMPDHGKDELHQLSDTFNRMFQRLEEDFEAQRNFTSDASHELRTPLTTILAQCEYAFENASGEQELYEAIGIIQKQGYRMTRLIDSLLQFTRMEQRTEEITFESMDLSELVGTVCREQRKIHEKNIALTEDVQPGIQIKGDMVLIVRMLENLVRNAYVYGKENGNIQVGLKQSAHSVLLTVADDGIGIDPQDLPNIWNRFYRADKSRSASKGAGLGLGLAMVKQIATHHGGNVKAESQPDQGSIFTVELPFHK